MLTHLVHVSLVARATVTEGGKLGGWNNGNLFSHNSAGGSQKARCRRALFPLKPVGKGPFYSLPASGAPDVPWLWAASLHFHMAFSLYPYLCPHFLFYLIVSSFRLRATLTTLF